jgi:sRNA-binding regulator protein Hfq
MRVLKDGQVKYKPSAYRDYERLSKPSFPMPRFVEGTKVQVYLGAGFGTGHVVSSYQDRCVVKLVTGNRSITVYDARSIRLPQK